MGCHGRGFRVFLRFIFVLAAVGCAADPSERTTGSGPSTPGGGGAGDGAGGMSSTDFGQGPNPTTPQPTPSQPTMDPAMDPAASSSLEPVSIDECGAGNPAGLADADVQKLIAGSGGAGSLRTLYPYDGTVFPRGIASPLLMWEGGAADVVYLHIQASKFEYKGCLQPTGMGQLQVPQAVWETAGKQTLGPSDPFRMELTVMSGGTVTGPVAQSFVIAQATIKGSIYYNSYSSLLPGAGGIGGSVLRIPPGGQAEKFVSLECNGCHSVSANGERLLTQALALGGRSYALAPGTPANPPAMPTAPRSSFGALSPDGKVFLSTSIAVEVARSSLAQALGAPTTAMLYETDTGVAISGTGIPDGVLMPMFSPDGTLLAFNDHAINNAHGLALMDFDVAGRKGSNYRVLYTEADTTLRPGWPFILPDNGAVVFTRTNGADFSGDGAGLIPIPIGPASDLYMVDISTGMHVILAKAMGFNTPAEASSNTTYLRFGADELHKNYFPTISPVAAGGYFWVFFDSLRHYGNRGLTRQLWGTAIAIDPNGDYTVDRSAPAYYLPGQEFGTGNHRAFAALDPCKKDGDDCTSGIDCCGGFCFVPENDSEFGEERPGKCTADVPMCAKTNERCTSDEDCCPPEPGHPQNTCIAGFCAFVPVPE